MELLILSLSCASLALRCLAAGCLRRILAALRSRLLTCCPMDLRSCALGGRPFTLSAVSTAPESGKGAHLRASKGPPDALWSFRWMLDGPHSPLAGVHPRYGQWICGALSSGTSYVAERACAAGFGEPSPVSGPAKGMPLLPPKRNKACRCCTGRPAMAASVTEAISTFGLRCKEFEHKPPVCSRGRPSPLGVWQSLARFRAPSNGWRPRPPPWHSASPPPWLSQGVRADWCAVPCFELWTRSWGLSWAPGTS